MVRYDKYLWYVLRHKWYVFLECLKCGIWWRGLVHDMSKFLPSEFIPYARHFYGAGADIKKGRDKTGYYKAGDSGDEAFDRAWLYHQHRNAHHWQYWVLIQDEEDTKVLEIPRKYTQEMLCDWRGAGRAQGTPDTKAWYDAHRDNMLLHNDTRYALEYTLDGVV